MAIRFGFAIFLFGIHFCLAEIKSIWSNNSTIFPYTIVNHTSGLNWRAAAQTGCANGRLFVPGTSNISEIVLDNIKDGERYWIGGIEYSTWRWTDQAPLYVYKGHLDIFFLRGSSKNHKNKTVAGNSAFRCHLSCVEQEKNVRFFGLRGEECFCFFKDPLPFLPREGEIRCNGNFDEKCGDEDGISVYKLERIEIQPTLNGKCVYADEGRRPSAYIEFLQDETCDTQRQALCMQDEDGTAKYVCQKPVCARSQKTDWKTANTSCRLLIVDNTNIDTLTDETNWFWDTYWIGLKRTFQSKWLDGVDIDNTDENIISGQRCLAISRSSETNLLSFTWRDCTEETGFICQSDIEPTRTSTHASTTEPTEDMGSAITLPTTTAPTVITNDTTSGRESSTVTQLNGAGNSHHNATDTLTTEDGIGNGPIIGIIAGTAVVVLVVISLAAYSKKKRKSSPRFNSNIETPSSDHHQHTIPSRDHPQDALNLIESNRVHAEENTYELQDINQRHNSVDEVDYDHLSRSDSPIRTRDTSTSGSGNNRAVQSAVSNHVGHGPETLDVYDHSGYNKTVLACHENVYDHSKSSQVCNEETYDISDLKSTTVISDETYDHFGDLEEAVNSRTSGDIKDVKFGNYARKENKSGEQPLESSVSTNPSTGNDDVYYNVGDTKETYEVARSWSTRERKNDTSVGPMEKSTGSNSEYEQAGVYTPMTNEPFSSSKAETQTEDVYYNVGEH